MGEWDLMWYNRYIIYSFRLCLTLGYTRILATSSSGFPHLIWKYIYITWYNSHHSQGLCWWLGSWGRMEKGKIETSTILKTKARTVVGDHTSWHKLGPAWPTTLSFFQIQGTKLTPLKSFLPGSTMGANFWHIKPRSAWNGRVSVLMFNLWFQKFGLPKSLVTTSSFCNKTFKSFGGRNFAPRYGQSNATTDTALIKHVNGNLLIL